MLGKKLINAGPAATGGANTFASENFNTVLYTGNGSTQRIGGYINRGAVFNGSSSYIQADGIFSSSPSVMSVSVWFRTTSDGNILDIGDSSVSVAQNRMFFSGGLLYVTINGGDGGFASTSATGLQDGNWHHIVAVWDDGSVTNGIKIYIDGASTPTAQANSTQSFNSALNLFIGANDNRAGGGSIRQYFDGTMDQVRIFNKELSSSEVSTLYGETHASTTISNTDIFNDNSGVALYQLDGNANDTGGVSGKFGSAAIFNGSSSYIHRSASGFPTGNNSRSISLWVDNKNTINAGIIGYGNTATAEAFYLYLNAQGKLGVYGYYYNYDSNYTLPTNQWVHLVITHDGTTTRVYANGTEQFNLARTFNTGTNSFRIGGVHWNNSSEFFNGKIDDVRVYSDVLTSQEIGYIYNNTTASIPTDNLEAYYKLDGDARDEQQLYDGTASNVTYAYDGTASNVTYQEATKFSPDLVWIKSRSETGHHSLFDSIRGIYKYLTPNQSGAEIDRTSNNAGVTAFDSNGFSVNDPGGAGENYYVNQDNVTYTAWCFNAGTSAAATNNDGSIASTVKANKEAGFSICSYTKSGTTGTMGHGLDSTPELILEKRTDGSAYWNARVAGITSNNQTIFLNESTGVSTHPTLDLWTTPTTSVFGYTGNNATAGDYIAYNFHSVDGYQKIGNYTGGTTNKIIETGFEPAFLLIKAVSGTNSSEHWVIYDNKRSPSNPRNKWLYPNLSNAENTVSGVVNFLTNGFQLAVTSANTGINGANTTYIYLAIAADPDTTTPTVENSFDVVTYTGNGSSQDIETDFKPDLVWIKDRDGADNHHLFDTIRGTNQRIMSNQTSAENTEIDCLNSFDSNGFSIGANSGVNANNEKHVAWCWKAGDHDDNLPQINTEGTIDSVVSVNAEAGFGICSWNTQSSNGTYTIGHGLSSAPELIINKDRDSSNNWVVWSSEFSTPANDFMYLNSSSAKSSSTDSGSVITSTTFNTKTGHDFLTNKNIISYCFHSVTGYQKIGSYSSTGATGVSNQITTGFRPRFLLVKSYSHAEDWYIFDSSRVNLSGSNDGLLFANTSAAENTGYTRLEFTDTGWYWETAFGGNSNGYDYIYLAIK